MERIDGDLIQLAKEGKFDIIVHGCNCFNTMNSGIAKAVREHYPRAYVSDSETKKGDINKLGTYTCGWYDPIVVNAYTQYDYGRDGKERFVYEAFAMILYKLKHAWPGDHYGFPYIGCGLAGGNEDRIVSMIEQFDKEISVYGGKVTLVRFA